jgi:hypothetical protein
MHDSRLEDLLRGTLRAEASSMSMTLTVGVLERRLVERRHRSPGFRRWGVAAAMATLAVVGGAVVLAQLQGNLPPVAATPSPSASARAVLPEPRALLSGYPDATLRLEHGEGPATGPVDPSNSATPGASPEPVEVGRIRFGGPFVVGLACLGEGEMVVQVTSPNLLGDVPYMTAHGPCDGAPVVNEYRAPPIDPASPGDVVTVAISQGASWRLAVGERPTSTLTTPEFPPVPTTQGWNVVSDPGAYQLSAADAQGLKTGVLVTMPDEATRAGVHVQCQGAGSLTITANGASPVDVPCDPTGTTRRLEFPAAGGELLSLEATGDRSGTWVRLTVEADAELASTYPAAPPLPDGLADVPYAAPDANVLAFGTLGSSRQAILPVRGATPGRPAGDLLPVGVADEGTGARLELVSIAAGSVIRNLARFPAPSFIFDSWVDATHGQVYYALADPTKVEFRRVSIGGTDDALVATVPREGRESFTAKLAADDTVFVVDACLTGPTCTRTIMDAATGEITSADRTSDPLCTILGVADGRIVASSRPACTDDAPTSLLAIPVDGGTPRVVGEAFNPDVSGGVVVATPDGLRVAFGADEGSGFVTRVIDVDSGDVSELPASADGGPALIPHQSVVLPPGWLLLTDGYLGDFPWQKAIDRPAPVLVNLVTGERIELVNLPHWTGTWTP